MQTPDPKSNPTTSGWSTTPSDVSSDAQGVDDYQDASRGPRLQKVLASAGVASRRACEALIEEGAVRVNGHLITTLPAWVNPKQDVITVHGRRVRTAAPAICLMFFKPRGVVCTADDPEGRKTIFDLVRHPSGVRLFSIGRLDMDSSGLLLMTNDGELSNLLTHPSRHVPRTYDVLVSGEVDPSTIQKLMRGIRLKDERSGSTHQARFNSVRITRTQRDRTRLRIVLAEGRNRQIRRMMLQVGHPVRKLRRVAFGPLKLADLRPGQWRDLSDHQIETLRRAAKGRPESRRDRA